MGETRFPPCAASALSFATFMSLRQAVRNRPSDAASGAGERSSPDPSRAAFTEPHPSDASPGSRFSMTQLDGEMFAGPG